jgi:hypothetical protein
MGSVFVRTRTHKHGKKVDYWVIEYRVNGKPRRETAGKVGIVTKTIARELLKKRQLQVKLGQWDMIEVKIPTLSLFTPEIPKLRKRYYSQTLLETR